MSITEHLSFLHEYKEKHGCADCKAKLPHYVLEFDHKPGFKKVDNVYRVLKKFGLESAKQEIKKCDVVCANCHKIRSWNREQES